MFQGIKSKLKNMATIKFLCDHAQVHALEEYQREPGAEHFLLAALDLPDGTARLAFERIGADPDAFRPAIGRQYDDALRSIGIEPRLAAEQPDAYPLQANTGLYKTTPSGQEVMQTLARHRKQHHPLLGVHVVAAVADIQHGVAARALRSMGIDAATLKSTAETIAEIRKQY